MRRDVTRLGAAVVAALLVLAAAAGQDGEEKVPLDKVLWPVLETVKARFPGAKLTGASKEKDKWVYEVSLTEKGKDKNMDVTCTPEGELLTIERAIDAKDLPKATAKAIEDKYPKGDVQDRRGDHQGGEEGGEVGVLRSTAGDAGQAEDDGGAGHRRGEDRRRGGEDGRRQGRVARLPGAGGATSLPRSVTPRPASVVRTPGGRDAKGLVGHRSASPWDDGDRRPSHADKRRAWRRELLGEEIRAALRQGANEREIQEAAERLLNLAA